MYCKYSSMHTRMNVLTYLYFSLLFKSWKFYYHSQSTSRGCRGDKLIIAKRPMMTKIIFKILLVTLLFCNTFCFPIENQARPSIKEKKVCNLEIRWVAKPGYLLFKKPRIKCFWVKTQSEKIKSSTILLWRQGKQNHYSNTSDKATYKKAKL